MKGAGVDCVRFGAAVLDELSGRDRMKILPRIAQDAAWHRAEPVRSAVKLMLQAYHPLEDVTEALEVEPGDAVLVGPENGGPGHVMFCGPTQLWHAIRPSVCPAPLFPPFGLSLKRIWRPTLASKLEWLET